MMMDFPREARVEISATVASSLVAAAERLPRYDNFEFYSSELQVRVCEAVREGCPEAFDPIVSEIRKRLGRWPYCALVNGLVFDEGNKVFVAINRAFGELVARPYRSEEHTSELQSRFG